MLLNKYFFFEYLIISHIEKKNLFVNSHNCSEFNCV